MTLAKGLAALLLAILGALTWQRTFVYKDVETLWRDTLDRNPDAFIAANNLGGALFARGETAAAAELFAQALRAKPDYAEGLDNLGLVKQREGKLDEAAALYRDALRSDPNLPNAHNNLGIVLAQTGQSAQALEHFDKAVQLRPSFAKAQQNRGLILERLGRAGDAAAAYRESLLYAPAAFDVAKRLAWILATDPDPRVRNGAEAVKLARAASAAAGDRDASALDILAAAYAEAGQLDAAVATAERALALVSVAAPAGAREGAAARLALYRAGSPFRRQAE